MERVPFSSVEEAAELLGKLQQHQAVARLLLGCLDLPVATNRAAGQFTIYLHALTTSVTL